MTRYSINYFSSFLQSYEKHFRIYLYPVGYRSVFIVPKLYCRPILHQSSNKNLFLGLSWSFPVVPKIAKADKCHYHSKGLLVSCSVILELAITTAITRLFVTFWEKSRQSLDYLYIERKPENISRSFGTKVKFVLETKRKLRIRNIGSY